MTLTYKLFGIPRNKEEFLDKMRKKREGERVVEIYLDSFQDDYGVGNSFVCSFYPILKSGITSLKLKNKDNYRIIFLLGKQGQKELREYEASEIEKMLSLGEELEREGFTVKIGSEHTIGEARESLEKFYQYYNIVH